MTKLIGGTQVRKGYYWNLKGWALHNVERDGEQLPGTAADLYWHAPLFLVLALAPLMGAAFLMFLPFIGFYLVAHAALRPVLGGVKKSAGEIAATLTPGWQPGEAHLAGRGGAEEQEVAGGPKAEAGDRELEEVEAEIAKRREPKA